MGYLKIFINLIGLMLTLLIFMVVGGLITLFLVGQSGSKTNGITITEKVDDDRVSYMTGVNFWGTEIKENFRMPVKYRTRNWISWEWYKKAMYVPDLAIDKVISVVSPVILPTWNAGQVAEYYIDKLEYDVEDTDFTTIVEYILAYEEGTIPNTRLDDALMEAKDAFTDYNGGYDDAYILYQENFKLFVQEHDDIYETMYRIAKYNVVDADGTKAYADINKRFADDDGEVKSGVYLVYTVYYISLFLAIFTTIQFPPSRVLNERLTSHTEKTRSRKRKD